MFRDPLSPGPVNAMAFSAVAGFLKRLGRPGAPTPLEAVRAQVRTTPVLIAAVTVPGVVRKKFVGKLKPLPGVCGKPERHRASPEIAQPPITDSRRRPPPPPKRCPFPNGRSITQLALKLW